MARRSRLDAELVRRGLARSRGEAAELVSEGRVLVAGQPAGKPATAVAADTPLVLRSDTDTPTYVSRGGKKLAAALDVFGVDVTGGRCLGAEVLSSTMGAPLKRIGGTGLMATGTG